MESPEQLEKALERLMPAAISDRGQRELERTLDGLASGTLKSRRETAPPRRAWWPLAVGMPAAAAAAFVVALSLPRPEDTRTAGGKVGAGATASPGTGAPSEGGAAAETTASSVTHRRPVPGRAPAHDPLELAEVPSKIFDIARRSAEFESRDGGMMLVLNEMGSPQVKLTTPEGAVIYQGPLDSSKVPEVWKKRADLLKRDLLKRIDARPAPVE